MSIEAAALREIVSYDPETGVFTWKSGRRAGASAGTMTARGYIQIGIGGRYYLAHRLAWLWAHGVWPAGEIDHANCDKADNRTANLRDVTRSQNAANTLMRADNASGFKGVSWFAPRGKWRARVTLNGRVRYTAYFDTAAAAHDAYIIAAKDLHGDFARAA